jgi:hypothetical protein
MVASGNVQASAAGKLRERRFSAGFGNRFQKKQRAVNRLNTVPVAASRGLGTAFGTWPR